VETTGDTRISPRDLEPITDELLDEWYKLRLEYAVEFQEHIQVSSRSCGVSKTWRRTMRPKRFLMAIIRSVKLKDEFPVSADNDTIRTKLRKKSIA
jgi:hypothetical protein